MKSIRRKASLFAALALTLTLSLPAFAGEATDAVKAKHGVLTDLVQQPKSTQNDQKLDAEFDLAFDYNGLAKATLPDWDKRDPKQLAEFTEVLKDLVRNAYRRNIKKTLGYDINFTGDEDGSDAGKIVHTVAKNKKNAREEPVSIDYVVRQGSGGWKIVDIVTEGSSLTRNYRNQFRKVIEKHSFDELLKRMKAKRDKGGEVG